MHKHGAWEDMSYLRSLLFLIVTLLPQSALAQETASAAQQPHWWQVVAGVLAIPAAFLGIAYSYILIRKTRLEAHKIELEILEKEHTLKELNQSQAGVAREIVRPIIESRQAQFLILRFVLLYVVLRLWGLVESALAFVVGGAFLGVQKVVGFDLGNPWILVPALLFTRLPEAVTWVVVIGIGWPLFRDLNAFLRVDLKGILMPWRK